MSILGVTLILLAALLLLLVWLRPGSTAAIVDAAGRPLPGSIATLERVRLGGVNQGLLIRGHHAANPVLLYLHGGPGTSELGMVRMHNMPTLERHYTVAVWDQRGAGLSYAAREPESGMTVEQFVADAHELTLLLCQRFNQHKIYLVGHSWGSLLAVLTVQRHPELYHAYVGVGQAVDMREGERISYEWTLAQARSAGDTRAVAQLEAIGPPPYVGELRRKLMTQRRILGKYGGEVHGNPRGGMSTLLRGLLRSSEYAWPDRINVLRGVFANMRLMWPKIVDLDLRVLTPEIKVPVYFLEGRYDYEAPALLVERYFRQLRAPRKELIWFEQSAHFVNTEEAEKFNHFFVDRLLKETQGVDLDIMSKQILLVQAQPDAKHPHLGPALKASYAKGAGVAGHPVCSFFALAFGISWGGILAVMSATDFNLLDLRPLDTGLIFVLMLLGPSVSGLALTALLEGRAGLRRLVARMTHWRLALRWYLVAMVTMPLLLLVTLWPLSMFLDPAFSPRFQWHLFVIGFIAGSFEEVGWTGFAAPRLLQRQRLFLAGLWLGLVWALWHVLVDFRQNAHAMGTLWLLEFAVFYIGALTAYRVLMTWVYANTQSLLLAVLMHASYTGWLFVLYPATSLAQGLVWQTGFAVALWVAVAVVMTASTGRGSGLSLQRPLTRDTFGEPRRDQPPQGTA